MYTKAQQYRRETGSRSEPATHTHLTAHTDPRRLNKGRYWALLAALLSGLFALGSLAYLASSRPSLAAPPDDPSLKLDHALHRALQLVDGDEPLRVIVYMQEKKPYQLDDLPVEKTERRAEVTNRLQQNAANARQEIQRVLDQYMAQNQVIDYRPLWIINGIQVTVASEIVISLANRADVDHISLDARISLLEPITGTDSALPATLLSPESPWSLGQTRVQHVWAGLGISGTGVTIAVMDTGADWQHPALLESYRGRPDGGLTGDGSPAHETSWFDAVEGSPEPFDPHGHGTHVVGTASGRHGIGVAPGSQWMAVRILEEDGYGYTGDIHAGFQWLLAPGGDPSLAPDIVNGSWSTRPDLDVFLPDVNALHAAGIITVFAAGNTGPEEGSVRAPANYPGVIAVGASDDIDALAWFSSRGPSAWTNQTKPAMIAPGTRILSSLPGGRYGYLSGTSMASPHVAGIYALVLSVHDQLDAHQATAILTSTARLPDNTQPDSNHGWGRVDAYSALMSVVDAASLGGHIYGAGLPLPGAAITVTTPRNVKLSFTSDAEGSFSAELVANEYSVEVTAYGFKPYFNPSLVVSDVLSTNLTIDLERLPHGTVTGRILDLQSGLPLSGTLRISNAPGTVSVGSDGHYEVTLPAGEYELVAWVNGHRLGRFTQVVTVGETLEHDFLLESAPTILLVDSGQWYGGSQLQIYAAALQDMSYAYSTLSVRDPYIDLPTLELISDYEIIIYSAPKDSPGMLGVGEDLSAYLDSGGKVLISGRNVAEIDETDPFPQRWWQEQLRGVYRGKAEPPFDLSGETGTAFEGLEVTLAEQDEFGNDVSPDASRPQHGAFTKMALSYPDGNAAALLAGQCEPYRIAYYGFGLQQIQDPAERASLLATTFGFFDQPETEVGALFDRPAIEELVPPAAQRAFPIELINLSETLTDTFKLELVDSTWPARIITDTLELGPCQSSVTRLEIDIPEDLPVDSLENFRLIATSTNFPEYERTLAIRLKTPGHILLVDDDRWYDQAPVFKAAMTAAGFDFDFWEIEADPITPTSPPMDLLKAYDFVVWYTGYDWFKPITGEESDAILAYLEQGGRLFLSSQDYLYYHAADPLTRDYLGVLQYWESVTPTIAYGGVPPSPFSDLAGPLPLEYGQYQNHGDGLLTRPTSIVSLWHDQGLAAGVASSGPEWRTVFWALPFETLPASSQPGTMNRVLGWLSDLGESTFQVGSRASLPGDTQSFTLTLRYLASGPGSMVSITNTLPISLNVDPASLGEGVAYDQIRRELTWHGNLEPGQVHQIGYRAYSHDELSPGTRIENLVEIYYEDHDLTLERTVPFWVNAPDTSASRLLVSPGSVRPGQPVTYELKLLNQGNAAGIISATVKLQDALTPLTDTIRASKGKAELVDNILKWRGWLQPLENAKVSVVVTAPLSSLPTWLPATAIIDDNTTDPVIVDSLLEYKSFGAYMPVVASNKP